MTGDRLGGVAGRVELKVLGVVAGLLVLRVELGHVGGWKLWNGIGKNYVNISELVNGDWRIGRKCKLVYGVC